MGKKPGRCYSLGDDLWRRRGDQYRRSIRFHTLAAPACILGPDVPDYLNLGRNDIELFANLFTDPGKFRAASADLFRLIYIVDDIYAGQIRGKMLTLRSLARVFGNSKRCFFLFFFNGFGFIEYMKLGPAFSFIRTAFFTLGSKNHLFQGIDALLQILYLRLIRDDSILDDLFEFLSRFR